MISNLIIAVILFLIFAIAMFYWFRFCIKKIAKEHKEGKMNFFYNLSIVIGIIAVIFSLYLYFDIKLFVSRSNLVKAQVIEVKKEQLSLIGHSQDSCFRPVFYYFDPISKNEKVIKSKVCANPAIFNVNDNVELLINPNEINSDPIENEWFALYGFSVVLGVLGAVFVALGFLGRFLYRMTSRKHNI